MSAEIQPTKIWLAENGTTFLSQPARVRKELAEVSNVWPEHRQSQPVWFDKDSFGCMFSNWNCLELAMTGL